MKTTEQLEHESGIRPLGEYPDHCWECRARSDLEAKQAACSHDFTAEAKTFGGYVYARWCDDCHANL